MGANFTPPETTGILGAAFANRPQNLVNSLQAGAAQFMGERFNNALMDPNNRAVVDPLSGRVIGVETNRGTLVEGRGLGNNVSTGDGENNAMMGRTMMASGGGGGMDSPGRTTPEQIDDLAINYLQSPFYAYSGTGNLFNPYGFAQGTLVDLLQTRGMTQPNQADTLGLFANPQDFS
jgi:hypothetical protein